MAFDQATRNRLQKFVGDARKLLSDEFTQQLQNTYGLDPITCGVAALSELPALSPTEQQTAQLLRDTLEHYLAASHKADPYKDKALVTAALDRIVREQAFTVLNRLAALRMAEARQFIMESISQGYQSKGFQLYQRIAGSSLGETGQTYQHYLFSVFDELSLDLAVLFDRYSSQGRLFPRETVLLELLDLINHADLEMLWSEDETIGWIYQYFNSKEERKRMRDESSAPRNSRELAVRNQFFTPRYVVEFLTDNTLGRIWYEMTQGETTLSDSCQYLVRRPNEVFLQPGETAKEQDEQGAVDLGQEELLKKTLYIQHRPIKDPRDIKMLDPACGSMHFGLYAFDLFEQIYYEAWDIEKLQGQDFFWYEEGGVKRQAFQEIYPSKNEFLADVPRLIIEHNIHGVDIDPRAAQIAGLSLWLRAHKSWSDNAIQPNQRPQIQRSNIVCAEPMPGEKALLKDFTSQIRPRVLGQLVEEIFDKMELAGEAGSLLKIEEEIKTAIDEAKSQKDESVLEVQGGLFGGDKWEVQEGKRYYNFGDVSEDFWGEAEQLILSQLERYAETAAGSDSGQKRLFATDAAKGFAFIDLCRKRFDVLLMNPPFGEAPKKTHDYFAVSYSAWNWNFFCAFTQRALELADTVGSITDISYMLKTSYSAYREKVILSNNSVSLLVDLGWDVLDANVEVNLQVFGLGFQGISYLDLGRSEDKSADLELSVRNCLDQKWITYAHDSFKSLPDSILSFTIPEWQLLSQQNKRSVVNVLAEAKSGLKAGKVDQFVRLAWEVDFLERGFKKKWSFFQNGGEYSPFYMSAYMVVLYEEDWKQIGMVPSSRITGLEDYWKPGISYGKRTDNIYGFPMPVGQVFSNEGMAVLTEPENYWFLLAFINSTSVQKVMNKLCGQHKAHSYFNKLCVPFETCTKIFDEDVKKLVSTLLNLDQYVETSLYFARIPVVDEGPISCVSEIQRWVVDIEKRVVDFEEIYSQLNYKVSEYLGDDIECDEPKMVDWIKNVFKDNLDESYVIKSIYSYFFGCAFELWLEDHDSTSEMMSVEGVFKELPGSAPLFNVNGGNKKSVLASEELYRFISRREGKHLPFISNVGEPELKKLLGCGSVVDFLGSSNEFFKYHLKIYSKGKREAPIYWPIQTQSKGYTLWFCYLNLHGQTLYDAINNYLVPKLEELSGQISAIGKNDLRKQRLESEFEEIKLLEEKLLEHAGLYKPSKDDGVLITAAPLYEFFQVTSWRKKLEKTWKDLEHGKYDWSQMAINYWPERVVRKSSEDRSIAVAHGLEHELWEQVEAQVGRSKKTKLVWQPKEMTDTELDTYIKNKIEQE